MKESASQVSPPAHGETGRSAPQIRLVWMAAAIALPALTLAGIAPRWIAPCAALLAVCAAIAAADLIRGEQRLAHISASLPDTLRLTKSLPAALPVTIHNASGADLRLRLAVPMPEGLESPDLVREISAPAALSRIDWPCTGIARGDRAIPWIHIEVASPLGLWAARTAHPCDCTLRVYPNLRDRATVALFLKTADPGFRLRRQLGKGREFENLRHYLPGDNFEDIHWKATARRAFPIVKLYRVEHAQEVYAVIDSSRLSARSGILDSYVDAALHLALVAQRQGDRFGLVTFSDRTHRFVRAHSGMDHFRLCRETIYNLHAERVSPDFREVFTSLQLNLRRRCLLVFFTSLDDALLAETFEHEVPLVARRHLVLVNVTENAAMRPLFTGQPPADLDSLYDGLAGQMLWNRMRKLQIGLEQRGVKLSLVAPDRIKTQVTAAYLDVKRRQAL
jgi:uncharacterized protein (DUF58 family)